MKYVPNILTIFRMVLTPVYIWLSFFTVAPHALLWAWIIFIIASLTDWFDGRIARKYNVVSNFGKIWDPLADKFLVLSALAALTWKAPLQLPWIIFVIILVRELAVTIMREVYAKRSIVMAADIWGKLKTVLQMVGITAYLGFWAFGIGTPTLFTVMQVWFWIVAFVTVLSGYNYLRIKKVKYQ